MYNEFFIFEKIDDQEIREIFTRLLNLDMNFIFNCLIIMVDNVYSLLTMLNGKESHVFTVNANVP